VWWEEKTVQGPDGKTYINAPFGYAGVADLRLDRSLDWRGALMPVPNQRLDLYNAFWECRIRGTAFKMPLPPCIETERLRLRPRRLNDIDAIVEMDLNPDVYRYRELGPETSMAIPDKTTVRNAVRSEILSSSPPDFWAVEWKDRQEFLGLAGLIAKPPRIRIAGLPNKSGTLFLTYRLAKGTWGQGVASEAAGAILDYGFRTLHCQAVMAFSHVDNIRSRRVLEKIAMRLVGKVLVQQESATSKQSNSETSNTARTQPAVYLCYLLDREAYLLNRLGDVDLEHGQSA
jgi:RimJ/RimL family protein N-acetyltransferase